MATTHQTSLPRRPPGPLGRLPDRVRCLFITTPERTGAWLAEALAADSATRVQLELAVSPSEGLARLGEQVFDAVLVSHEPGHFDALELVEGLRAGGSEEPLIVLGAASETDMAPLCFEVGADAYVCVPTGTTRGLLWLMARAIERHQLLRENRRLQQGERHRLQQEQREAERLLAEQRRLVQPSAEDPPTDVAAAPRGEPASARGQEAAPWAGGLPAALKDHYRDLLRTQVIMGSGNLRRDVSALADLLVGANATACQALELHTDVLTELIRGLGNRSARHVMARADLMALELLMHLTDGYRGRYLAQSSQPRQQRLLPGFEAQSSPESS